MERFFCALCLFVFCFAGATARAQEPEQAEILLQSRRYLDINISKLEKCTARLERKQKHLLAKLSKKEHKLERRLRDKDSAAWARLREDRVSFDSISNISQSDAKGRKDALASKPNAVIDSLKGVSGFATKLADKSGIGSEASRFSTYEQQLAELKGKANYQDYLSEQITRRANTWNSLGSKFSGVQGLQQQLYYAKAQMQAYTNLAEEPGKLEQKAYEFLQGQAGFEETVDRSVNGAPMGGEGAGTGTSLTAADLERMGYQTKRQLSSGLRQKFGSSLGAVQQQMGGQVSSWQQQAHDVTSQAKEAKQSLASIKHATKPSFKINPMRCLPFWQRIEKSYDFQTSRATADGKPAMLQLGAMAGYRQSPSLTAGLGVAASFGLGQSWSQIRFTFEGVGFRSFASWNLVYGVAAYAGYERMYKQAAFTTAKGGEDVIRPTTHNTNSYNESSLLGLTKSYRINSKHNGAIQVLYDFWWREKGLNTPIMIRFREN